MDNWFVQRFDWEGPTFDTNDEYFSDIIELATLEEANAFDAVLVGEPTDIGQVGARGASLGPEGLRIGLSETKTAHLTEGSMASVADLGDIDVPWGVGIEKLQRELISVTSAVHDCEPVAIFLGGGHDLAYPNVAPLLDRHDSVGVINFDAHADVRELSDGPYNGTPFRQAFDDGLAEYALVGARHFETSEPYLDFLAERDCTVVSAEEAGRDPRGVVETAIESMEDVDAIHLSCDLDVLDMTVAPATNAPTPGGLLPRELYECLRAVIKEPRVTSLDLIGCAPPLGTSTQRLQRPNINRTTIVGSRALAHALHAASMRQTSS